MIFVHGIVYTSRLADQTYLPREGPWMLNCHKRRGNPACVYCEEFEDVTVHWPWGSGPGKGLEGFKYRFSRRSLTEVRCIMSITYRTVSVSFCERKWNTHIFLERYSFLWVIQTSINNICIAVSYYHDYCVGYFHTMLVHCYQQVSTACCKI